MGTQQQSCSSSSHGQGSSPTEGEGQTSPKSVGGTSTSNVRQGLAGAQQDTNSSNSDNRSNLILHDSCKSFSDVPPDRRFHPLMSGTQHARWRCHTQLAKMGFDEILDLTADIFLCPFYTLSCVLWVRLILPVIYVQYIISETFSLVCVICIHIIRVR